MVYLFGKHYTKKELLEKVGNMEQLASVNRLQVLDGKGNGSEVIQVNTGGGLLFNIHVDRGMDIGRVDYQGLPYTWVSPNGLVNSKYYESQGKGWLRSFYGGLVTTCGLLNVGSPSHDKGNSLDDQHGMHGRIANIPAENVSIDCFWKDDDYHMIIRGRVSETAMFGERVYVNREIKTCLGSNEIELTDTVENMNFYPIEHMILYHTNIGYPLLDEQAEISIPSTKVQPRETDLSLDNLSGFEKPTLNYDERVYYHMFDQEEVVIQVKNGIRAFTMTYNQSELDHFVQWKLAEKGNYVLGLEPSNCGVEGREAARASNELPMLQPFETKVYHINYIFN